MSRVWELGKHDLFFFSDSWKTKRELFCDSSSSSSSILLSHLRFLFLVFDSSSSSLFFFGFSFESSILLRWPETSFCGCGSSQHWHRSKTKGWKSLISSLISVCSRTNHEMVNCSRWTFQVLYGSGARKFARSCCSSWLTSHEGIVSWSQKQFWCNFAYLLTHITVEESSFVSLLVMLWIGS